MQTLRDKLNEYSETSTMKRLKPEESPTYTIDFWLRDLKKHELDQEFDEITVVDRTRNVEIVTSTDGTAKFEIREDESSVIRFSA